MYFTEVIFQYLFKEKNNTFKYLKCFANIFVLFWKLCQLLRMLASLPLMFLSVYEANVIGDKNVNEFS